MEITGTLHGLPIGPVTVRGRAAGAVLVRNPTFTLTFTHPEVVNAGEPYTLDVTVTNTTASPANFVSLNLFPRNVSGATIVGEPTRADRDDRAGRLATVSFDLDLEGHRQGHRRDARLRRERRRPVRAEDRGRRARRAAVARFARPAEGSRRAAARPADAAIGLLGKAWAVATAPAAALPTDVQRFSKKIVSIAPSRWPRPGFRVSLHEPLRDSATQLLMDFIGSDYARLPARITKPDDLEFARTDFAGFDELRRRSVRGDVFAQAVAALLTTDLASRRRRRLPPRHGAEDLVPAGTHLGAALGERLAAGLR